MSPHLFKKKNGKNRCLQVSEYRSLVVTICTIWITGAQREQTSGNNEADKSFLIWTDMTNKNAPGCAYD